MAEDLRDADDAAEVDVIGRNEKTDPQRQKDGSEDQIEILT